MKLYVVNKAISLRDGSDVLNENNEKVYAVKGKLISPTRKKKMYDLQKNKLFTIRNKFWHLFLKSALIYDANGKKIMKVQRKFNIKENYSIKCKTDNYRIDGKILGWNFKILRNDEVIATITKKFGYVTTILGNDAFEVDVINPEDATLCVAMCIAIDNIQDRK